MSGRSNRSREFQNNRSVVKEESCGGEGDFRKNKGSPINLAKHSHEDEF